MAIFNIFRGFINGIHTCEYYTSWLIHTTIYIKTKKSPIKQFYPKNFSNIEHKEAVNSVPKDKMWGRVNFEKFKSLGEELLFII